MIPDLEIDVSIDGNIAIEQLQKKDYNVLLLDILMPEMDGYETVEYIRKKMKEPFSSIKIIAMTANATQSERENCINSGMNGYITKPLDQKDVMDNLIKVLII
ncbi:MAG: response regulator [Bacteroidetes bacterium]|nr:response regulator [Bacteroidota bacterium]